MRQLDSLPPKVERALVEVLPGGGRGRARRPAAARQRNVDLVRDVVDDFPRAT